MFHLEYLSNSYADCYCPKSINPGKMIAHYKYRISEKPSGTFSQFLVTNTYEVLKFLRIIVIVLSVLACTISEILNHNEVICGALIGREFPITNLHMYQLWFWTEFQECLYSK